jgi:hypothetical protein
VTVTGKNLFNKNDLYTNHYIALGGEIKSTDTWDVSAKIPVIPNTQYTLSGVIQVYNNIYHAFYDSNDKCLLTIAVAVGTTVMTAPANASYLRLSIRKVSEDKETVQLEQGSTATTYEPYFNGGSATAENLFKVGDYKDVQSILNGEVTRNVGVKVLDGTESWNYVSGNTPRFLTYINTINDLGLRLTPLYSTHFLCVSDGRPLAQVPNNTIYTGGGTGGEVFIQTNNFGTSVATLKQYLQSQYNAGTPVIIVYPLAEPTTETVTAQPLTTQAGTNIVEITESSIDDLGLEVSYKATV